MATIKEILSLSPEERHNKYCAYDSSVGHGIDSVFIEDQEFTGYKDYTFIFEKSYVKSPERGGDGSISNLNSYSTFLTPHLKIDFSLLSIDDYRRLMNLIYSKNEFRVRCYDVVANRYTTNMMYFTTEELPKLWTIVNIINSAITGGVVDLYAVQDYTVEMVGTNTSVDTVNIVYHLNPPDNSLDNTVGSENYALGEEVIIGEGAEIDGKNIIDYTFNDNYRFDGWKDINGNTYIEGSALFLYAPLVLYAQWVSSDNYTLSFDYGIVNVENTYYPVKRYVNWNESIGDLPYPTPPKVEYKGKQYDVYSNGKWFTAPEYNSKREEKQSNDNYWRKSNSTIYLIYERAEGVIYFYENLPYGAISYQRIVGEYGTAIPDVQFENDNYEFLGWYLGKEDDAEKFTETTMPPIKLSVYAHWRAKSK